MYLKVILLFAILFIACFYQIKADDPNYKLVFDKIIKETETKTIVENNLQFSETDGIVKVSGELKQLVDLDDTWKMVINLASAEEPTGEYKSLITLSPKGVCQILKTHYKKYFYNTLKENVVNAPDPDQCPIMARNYMVNEYEVDTSMLKNFLQPGYYRVTLILLKDDEEVLKYILQGHVVENN